MNPSPRGKIEVLILAAGLSCRLGRPKQLVLYRGVPLVRHVVLTALNLLDTSLTVVANPLVDMAGALADLPVNVLTNDAPSRGLGSSIKKGVSYAKGEGRAACLFILGDQPFIRGQHLKDLIAKSKDAPESIIATAYPGDSLGVPALFPAVFFDDLLAIEDHAGAQEVIRAASGTLALAPPKDSLFDLDTPEDLAILREWEMTTVSTSRAIAAKPADV